MEDNRTEWQRNCGKRCGFPMRGVIALLAFFALASTFAHRLSVAFVVMIDEPTNETDVKHESCHDNNEEIVDIPRVHNTNHTSNRSKKLENCVVPSFLIGYLLTLVPGGVLSDIYGAKWVLSICILLSSSITIVIPFVTHKDTPVVTICLLRMLMGVLQGPIIPSVNSFLSSWVPKRERATLSTLAFSGVPIGLVLTRYMSANSQTNYREWEISHYVFGAMGFVCFLLLISASSSHPNNHPCIKPEELVFLNDHIKTYEISFHSIPWKAIMLNKPMISVIIAQMGHEWGFYLMLTGIPDYLKDSIQVSLMRNGFVTCLPYIAMFVWTNLAGMLADWVVKTRTMEVGTQRKLYTILAAVPVGTLQLFASFAGCRKFLVIGFFVISVTMNGFYYSGLRLSPMDMSQTYAGTLLGIAYGFGNFTGICCPIVTNLMTVNDSIEEWRIVFWLSFFIYIITALGFVKWGSADVQPFDPSFTA